MVSIYNIQQLIEKKTNEYREPLDNEKTFDRINHWSVFNSLSHQGTLKSM